MTRDHMDEKFADAARDQLVSDVTDRTHSREQRPILSGRPGELRTVLVTAVVAIALVVGTVAVFRTVSERSAPTPADSSRALKCNHTATAPFECQNYVTVDGTEQGKDVGWLRRTPVQVKFELMNGFVTLIAAGPINTNDVQIQTSPTGGTSTMSGVSLVGCTGGTICAHDQWLTKFFNTRLTYTTDGEKVTISNGSDTLHLIASQLSATAAP